MSRPVDAVIDFLEAEQARGVSHVFLDDEARDSLRELYKRTQTTPKPKPEAARPATAPPAAAAEPAKPVAAPAKPIIEGKTKSERLASLRQQAETWAPAKSLGTLRDTLVFATGDPEARIMLVGEAPGYEEERKREPFVGPAGQKLDDILKAMGFSRGEVYLSNVVKFRPATARQTTNNRKPSPEEISACIPIIRAELEIVRPSCVIALGSTAAEALLGSSGGFESMRGSWHKIDGIPLRVTYHPSYLLQTTTDNTIKRQLWEDMLAAMDHLGLPVSEKQRGFFLPKKA